MAYLQDGLGSVIATVNSAGSLLSSQRFDAWGNKGTASGTTPTYGFTGREPDATGLTYFRARYQHPGIGRFLSRDPAGMADAVSPYAYVANDPVNFVDPTGEYAEVVVNGKKIVITLPIEYSGSGATPAVTARFNRGIASNWSGKIDGYDVTVKVLSPPPAGTPEDKKNIIDVPKGDGRAYVNGVGGNTGVWPAKRPGWTAAHEAGHLMGLDDKYSDTGGAKKGWEENIMATRDGKPDGRNIAEIIKANPKQGGQNLKEMETGFDPIYIERDSSAGVRSQK